MILDSCRRNGEIELGTIVSKEISEMEPVDAGNYVQLAHCFASTAKWDGVGESWVQMRSLGLKKAPAGIDVPLEMMKKNSNQAAGILVDLSSKLECCTDRVQHLKVFDFAIDALAHDSAEVRTAACIFLKNIFCSVKNFSAGIVNHNVEVHLGKFTTTTGEGQFRSAAVIFSKDWRRSKKKMNSGKTPLECARIYISSGTSHHNQQLRRSARSGSADEESSAGALSVDDISSDVINQQQATVHSAGS
ncbi:pentatricopeptide repeat-containing protein [Dorcoceras hygrometricum]|uniref:Pentatricopeptide repeat-containing protein n=1 Tax=Dorcoceras hygrometricum TaxID=472368 RepID=A0A2Z7AE14_9LAMI|nr:pentatricopeptide repeat-containing protein [Dorcoceras hygrometricum]